MSENNNNNRKDESGRNEERKEKLSPQHQDVPSLPRPSRERSPSSMSVSSAVLEWDPSADVGAMGSTGDSDILTTGASKHDVNQISGLESISSGETFFGPPLNTVQSSYIAEPNHQPYPQGHQLNRGYPYSTPEASPRPLPSLHFSPVNPEEFGFSLRESAPQENFQSRRPGNLEAPIGLPPLPRHGSRHHSQENLGEPPHSSQSKQYHSAPNIVSITSNEDSSESNNNDELKEDRRTPERFVSEASTDWEYDNEKKSTSKYVSDWQTNGITRSEIEYRNRKRSGSSTSAASCGSLFVLQVHTQTKQCQGLPSENSKTAKKSSDKESASRITNSLSSDVERDQHRHNVGKRPSGSTKHRQEIVTSSESDPSSMCVAVNQFLKNLEEDPAKDEIKYDVLKTHRDYHMTKVWKQISKLEKLNRALLTYKRRPKESKERTDARQGTLDALTKEIGTQYSKENLKALVNRSTATVDPPMEPDLRLLRDLIAQIVVPGAQSKTQNAQRNPLQVTAHGSERQSLTGILDSHKGQRLNAASKNNLQSHGSRDSSDESELVTLMKLIDQIETKPRNEPSRKQTIESRKDNEQHVVRRSGNKASIGCETTQRIKLTNSQIESITTCLKEAESSTSQLKREASLAELRAIMSQVLAIDTITSKRGERSSRQRTDSSESSMQSSSGRYEMRSSVELQTVKDNQKIPPRNIQLGATEESLKSVEWISSENLLETLDLDALSGAIAKALIDQMVMHKSTSGVQSELLRQQTSETQEHIARPSTSRPVNKQAIEVETAQNTQRADARVQTGKQTYSALGNKVPKTRPSEPNAAIIRDVISQILHGDVQKKASKTKNNDSQPVITKPRPAVSSRGSRRDINSHHGLQSVKDTQESQLKVLYMRDRRGNSESSSNYTLEHDIAVLRDAVSYIKDSTLPPPQNPALSARSGDPNYAALRDVISQIIQDSIPSQMQKTVPSVHSRDANLATLKDIVSQIIQDSILPQTQNAVPSVRSGEPNFTALREVVAQILNDSFRPQMAQLQNMQNSQNIGRSGRKSPIGFFIPLVCDDQEFVEEKPPESSVFYVKGPKAIQECLKDNNPECYKSIKERDDFLITIKRERQIHNETLLREALESNMSPEEINELLTWNYRQGDADEKRRLKAFWELYVESQNVKENKENVENTTIGTPHVISSREMKERTHRLRMNDPSILARQRREAEERRKRTSRNLQRNFSTNLRRFQKLGGVNIPDRLKLGPRLHQDKC